MQRAQPDVPEARHGVFAVGTESTSQVRVPGVSKLRQNMAIGGDRNTVSDLDDSHPMGDPERKSRKFAGGEEPLAARVFRVLLGQEPPALLESQRIEMLVRGVVPDNPADLPRVGAPGRAAPQLAYGPHVRGDDEVLVPGPAQNQCSVGVVGSTSTRG